MTEFYHQLVTEKSFKLLQELRKKFDFVLIGGWAVFLYTQALKSKDIDIIIDYKELTNFKKEFEVSKNERLKKYEVKTKEIDIDIYLPFYSNLGLPIKDVQQQYCQKRQGFLVPIPAILLILKIRAFEERKGSSKGQKDTIDIFSLIKKEQIDWQKYEKLIERYNLEKENNILKELISSTVHIPELNLLNHQMSRLKKRVLREIE